MDVDFSLPKEQIELEIAQATEMQIKWTHRLEKFRDLVNRHKNDKVRIQIDGQLKGNNTAADRLQSMIDNYNDIVDILKGFREVDTTGDKPPTPPSASG